MRIFLDAPRLLLAAVAAFAALAAAAGLARADRPLPDPVAPPAGWQDDPAHAEAVRRGLLVGMPDGVTPTHVRVRSARAPEGGAVIGGAVVELPAGEAPGALVRARIDDLHDVLYVQAHGGELARLLGWQERVDPAARTVEARLEWTQEGSGTTFVARAVWVRLAGPDRIAEHRAECLLGEGAPPTARAACDEALASLALPPAGERQPLDVAPAAGPSPEVRPPGDDAIPLEPGQRLPGQTTPRAARPTPEGLDIPIARDPPPARQPGQDWRPIWVVVGLLLVGLALFWNHRKRKEILEAEAAEQERLAAEARAAAAGGAEIGDDGEDPPSAEEPRA